MLRILLFASLFFSLLLNSCTSEPDPLPTIRLGHAPHDHHSALYIVAQLPDYFKQHGNLYLEEVVFKEHYRLIDHDQPVADVKVQSSTGGGQLIRKLHEKQLDIAFGSVPAMIHQIDAGSSLKIVAPLMSEGAGLVLGKKAEATDWDSFVALVKQSEKPLRIGYKIQTSVQNLIFEQALRAEGISFSREEGNATAQLIVLNLHGAKNLIPALKNGLIDGFVIMQPFVALAEEQGVGKTVAQLCDLPPEQKWAGHPCCAIGANGDLLESDRDLLSRLVTLLLRGNRYLQQYPEQSTGLVANWLGTSIEVEKSSLPTIKFLVDFPPEWHRGVSGWLETMNQQGRLTGKLNADTDAGTNAPLLYDMSIYQQARKGVFSP